MSAKQGPSIAKRTKKQHFVPRLHLRKFLGDSPKGMLWVYDLKRDTVRPAKPENTGAENNFYSVKDTDGTYYDGLDHWFTDVEDKAATPYEKLLRDEKLNDQERADFSTFVASLYVRSPSLIEAAADGYGQIVQLMTNMEWGTRERFEKNLDKYEAERGPIAISRDELWEFHNDKSRYTIQVERTRGLSIIGASDGIQMILFNREWYLLEAGEDFFITSDSPVFRGTPDKDYGFYGDGGFLNPDAEVTFPLSPKLTLLITGHSYPRRRVVMPRPAVWEMNRVRAYGARSHLYAPVRDDRVHDLAREYKDAGYRIQVGGGGPFAEVEVLPRMHNRREGDQG